MTERKEKKLFYCIKRSDNIKYYMSCNKYKNTDTIGNLDICQLQNVFYYQMQFFETRISELKIQEKNFAYLINCIYYHITKLRKINLISMTKSKNRKIVKHISIFDIIDEIISRYKTFSSISYVAKKDVDDPEYYIYFNSVKDIQNMSDIYIFYLEWIKQIIMYFFDYIKSLTCEYIEVPLSVKKNN